MQKKLFLFKLLFFYLFLYLFLFNLFGKSEYIYKQVEVFKRNKQAVKDLEIYMMPVNG